MYDPAERPWGNRGMRYAPAVRLLGLLLELEASRAGLSVEDMQARLRCGRRTVERLLAALRQLLPLIEEVETGERGKRWRARRAGPRVYRSIAPEELAAAELAAKLLDRERLGPQADRLRDLIAKIRADMPESEARRADPDVEALTEAEGLAFRPGPRQQIDPGVLESLRYAIKACRKVKLHYRYRMSGKRGVDRVQPYGFLYGNRHYLVAYSENEWAQDVRNFALGNIDRIELLNEPFEQPRSFDLKQYVRRSFGTFQERPVRVVLRFEPAVAEEAREFLFHHSQRMRAQGDGSLLVSFKAGGLLEMAWHLVTWGAVVQVMQPRRLRETIAELCRSVAALYENEGRGRARAPSGLAGTTGRAARRPAAWNGSRRGQGGR